MLNKLTKYNRVLGFMLLFAMMVGLLPMGSINTVHADTNKQEPSINLLGESEGNKDEEDGIKGSGTQAEPYIVETEEDIQFMHAKMQEKDVHYFKLATDIDGDNWSIPKNAVNSHIDADYYTFRNYKGQVFGDLNGSVSNMVFETSAKDGTIKPLLTRGGSGSLNNVKFLIEGKQTMANGQDELISGYKNVEVDIDGLKILGDGTLGNYNGLFSQVGNIDIRNVYLDVKLTDAKGYLIAKGTDAKKEALIENINLVVGDIAVRVVEKEDGNSIVVTDNRNEFVSLFGKGNVVANNIKINGAVLEYLFEGVTALPVKDEPVVAQTFKNIQLQDVDLTVGLNPEGSVVVTYDNMYIANGEYDESKNIGITDINKNDNAYILKDSYFNVKNTDNQLAVNKKTLDQLKVQDTYVNWDFGGTWSMVVFPELNGLIGGHDTKEIKVLNNPTEWTKEDVILELQGAKVLKVTDFLGEEISTRDNRWTIRDNDYLKIEYETKNKEVGVLRESIDKIDKLAPYALDVKIEDNFINEATALDKHSGIDRFIYKIDGGQEIVNKVPPYQSLEDGLHVIEVNAIDNVGNQTGFVEFKFFKEGNTIEIDDDTHPIKALLVEISDMIDALDANPSEEGITAINVMIAEAQGLINDLGRKHELREVLQNELDNLQNEVKELVSIKEINVILPKIEAMIKKLSEAEVVTEGQVEEVRVLANEVKGMINQLSEGKVKKNLQDEINRYIAQLDEFDTIIDIEKGIKIVEDKLTVKVGDVGQLTHNSSLDVVWSSDNEDVATINEFGVVTGVSAGKATMTVEIHGSDKSDSLEITVVDADIGNEDVKVESVNIKDEDFELGLGLTAAVDYEVLPEDAKNKDVEWSSDDEEVATVVDGVVEGIATGNAVITVKTVDGGLTDTVVVTVVENDFDDVDVNKAIDAVERAEETFLQGDVDEAMDLVNNLEDSDIKTNLLARLSSVQVAVNLILEIDEDIANLKSLDGEKAIQAKIDELPMSAEKIRVQLKLNSKVQGIEEELNNELLNEAIDAVEIAEVTKNQEDIDAARAIVAKLADGKTKSDLSARLDKVQEEIDLIKSITEDINNMKDLKNKKDIQDKINKLPEGAVKDELQAKFDAKVKLLEKGNIDVIEDDIDKLEDPKDKDKIQDKIDKLPEGEDKDKLQAKLDEKEARLVQTGSNMNILVVVGAVLMLAGAVYVIKNRNEEETE